MTDTAADPGAWVPRLGDATIPARHAELIRGLYRLAAWVADHPDIPAPLVRAQVSAVSARPRSLDWDDQCRVVDQVALALGVQPEYRQGGNAYMAGCRFGSVDVYSAAVKLRFDPGGYSLATSHDGRPRVRGGDAR